MALFGKADHDLPLLTQFYQVDWTEEMSVWIETVDPFPEWMSDDFFMDLLILHPSAKSLMDDVCNKRNVFVADLEVLEKMVLKYLLPTFHLLYDDKTRSLLASHFDIYNSNRNIKRLMPMDSEGNLDISATVPLSNLRWGTARHSILSDIVSDLHAVVMGEKPVARCPECRSVFLITRKGREFCSVRCSNRQRARRARVRRAQKESHITL